MISFESKKKLVTVSISCAVIFLVLYLITNFSALSGFFGGVFSVLSPLLIGAAIAYILNPLLKLFEFKIFKKLKSKGLRRSLSLVLTYVVAILICVAILFLIVPQLLDSIRDLASKFNLYMDSTAELINSLIDNFTANNAEKINFDGEKLKETAISLFTSSGDLFSTVGTYAKDFLLGLFEGVKNVLVGFFVSIYILISKENLQAQTRRLTAAILKPNTRKRFYRYARTAHRTFGNFFIGKIIDSCIVGIITFIFLLIFKIPYPLLIASFVAITDIIPVFGPFIGAIPSAFIIFIAEPKKALIFVILILVIQQLDGNIIAPKILGESTGISSLGVVVAIVIMGEYFGLIGMIVGVPIFATISIILNELIENKLKSKEMPHAIEDYYPSYSLVDPHEEHQKIGARLFSPLVNTFKKMAERKASRKSKVEPATAPEATEGQSTEATTEEESKKTEE